MFNLSRNQTTDKSPFEVVYGVNSISHMDLITHVSNVAHSVDGGQQCVEIQRLHKQVMMMMISKKNNKYRDQDNKNLRREIYFRFDYTKKGFHLDLLES